VWADTLSRELDTEDWQLNPRLFANLQAQWGPHTIDRFASMLNTQLPRWRDPQCEAVDCLRLPDAAWRRENNYCNPPWTALPALAAKLNQSQAPATVIAPYWPNKTWYHALRRLATAILQFPSSRDLYFPAGSASAWGSDHTRGASWPFGSHPLMALHPTRSHRQSVTPRQGVFYITTDSRSPYKPTPLPPTQGLGARPLVLHYS
jgi:hypothetical protein